jgi:hypothetical protein
VIGPKLFSGTIRKSLATVGVAVTAAEADALGEAESATGDSAGVGPPEEGEPEGQPERAVSKTRLKTIRWRIRPGSGTCSGLLLWAGFNRLKDTSRIANLARRSLRRWILPN